MEKQNLFLLAIVAIVAVVGIVVFVLGTLEQEEVIIEESEETTTGLQEADIGVASVCGDEFALGVNEYVRYNGNDIALIVLNAESATFSINGENIEIMEGETLHSVEGITLTATQFAYSMSCPESVLSCEPGAVFVLIAC